MLMSPRGEVRGYIVKELRINDKIRAREVRVIGEKGEQLGVIPLSQALQMARERDLDLVEVAPTANPPVCRIFDYGKFRYEQTKKEREARRRQKAVMLRQVRFRPKTDDHDIESKIRLVKKLIDEGNKVKVNVIFRGREITHPEIGRELLGRVVKALEGMVTLEKTPAIEGRNMTAILAPPPARSKDSKKIAKESKES